MDVPTGRRPNASAGALFVELDPGSRRPLYEQLYLGIRAAVRNGRLKPRTRIPSTRALANELAVSRTTVLLAVQQLIAEGYLWAQPRSGTRVAAAPPDTFLTTTATAPAVRDASVASRRVGLAADRAVVFDDGAARLGIAPRPFRPGVPALDHFPADVWARLAIRRYRRLSFPLLDHVDPAGYAPLRAAIASHVEVARGIHCTPEDIIITSGAQQALTLAVQALLNPGDEAWLEDPGYPGMRGAFELAGVRVVPVRVDADGIDVQAGIRRAPRARAAYVTPSHQFPLGATMTARRRASLVEWASSAGAWIIEDDYDSECRFAGKPLPALHALDRHGRVLYVGTFSKTVFPSLRIGYLIVPPDLVTAIRKLRALADGHPSPLDQAILADFIAGGHFSRHVRRMRALYAERQQRLVAAASRDLAGLATVRPAQAGLHLLAWLNQGVPDRAVSEELARSGIEAPALSRYYAESDTVSSASRGALPGALLLGYGTLDDHSLVSGIRAIRRVLLAFKHGMT